MKALIISLVILAISGLTIITILGISNYSEFSRRKDQQNASQTTHGNGNVTIIYPQINSEINSPLNMNGRVPAGWMFEGSSPVKILGEDRKLIAQGHATEVIPGSWTSGQEIEFITDIKFSTNDKNGFIVLEKDNPSGLEENADLYEFSVKFNLNSDYQCPSNGWVNCMPILDEKGKKACSQEAIEWYKKNCDNFEGTAL